MQNISFSYDHYGAGDYTPGTHLCAYTVSLSLPLSPLPCVESAVSARSSVHSQGVLRAGSFLKALLMDWPDIPSKWSTLSVNSLSEKDPSPPPRFFFFFTFPFYKSSPRYEVHKEGQMSTKSSLCVRPGGKMDWGEKESIGSPFMC